MRLLMRSNEFDNATKSPWPSPSQPGFVRTSAAFITPLAARRSAAMLAFALLSGCSTFPNQIAGPTINFNSPPQGVKANYLVNYNPIGYQTGSQIGSTILPVETTLTGIQTQIMAMQAAYASQQNKLLLEVDLTSNLQFFGMIASAAGIATKSNAWRNGGAGMAGLSNLWSSHYGIAVQSTNYGLAAQALDCASGEIDYITPTFWSDAYDPQGVFRIPKEIFTVKDASAADVAVAYDTLSNMYQNLHKTVAKIDQKLRSLQASVTIPTVSVTDIQDAVAGKTAAKNAGDVTAKEVAEGAKKALTDAVAAADKAKQAADASQAAALKASADFNTANKLAEDQNKLVLDKTQLEFKARANLMAHQTPSSELASADDNQKRLFAESNRRELHAAKAQADKASLDLAKESSILTGFEKLRTANLTSLKLKSAQFQQDEADAKAAQDKANATKKFVDLLSLGAISKAIQLPANLNACVAVMGK